MNVAVPIPKAAGSFSSILSICPQHIDGALIPTGFPVVSYPVTIHAYFIIFTRDCNVQVVPSGDWSITSKPSGSSSVLAPPATTSIVPSTAFTIDKVGAYTISFTGCSGSGCDLLVSGSTVHISPFTEEITINGLSSMAVPPDIRPVYPASYYSTPTTVTDFPDVSDKCNGGGGVVDPQWVTVEQWHNSLDYKLLEGLVASSRISRIDNEADHFSEDHNESIVPDPKYLYLVSSKPEFEPGQMAIEWESNSLPTILRPTTGDRVSAFGYWIHDCAHPPFYTEIHPAVGMAVHRLRAIAIPTSATINFGPSSPGSSIGSNVYVPGVITDVWFNRNGGETTENCSSTGLHQPYEDDPAYCIPVPSTGGKNPINRIFEFNIYLPKSPKVKLASLGKSGLPDVPLYKEVSSPFSIGSAGPSPTVNVITEGDVTYLKVSIDLTSFSGDQYSRRIVAGWAYPSPDNWDLEKWRVRVNSLDITDDADAGNDGDWRFWFNTNNRNQEWTKMFYCDNCATGLETFGGRPFETGSPTSPPWTVSLDDEWEANPGSAAHDPPRYLGPDSLLYPNQLMWVHTSGFDEEILSDDTGSVNDLFRPHDGLIKHSSSTCTVESQSGFSTGCGSYILNYEVLSEGPEVPQLSTAATQFYNSYVITPAETFLWTKVDTYPAIDFRWHPINMNLSKPVSIDSIPIYSPKDPEEDGLAFSATDKAKLRDHIVTLMKSNPIGFDKAMKELSLENDLTANISITESTDYYNMLKDVLPTEVWNKYFANKVGQSAVYGKFVPSEAGAASFVVEIENGTFGIPVVGQGITSLVFNQQNRTITLDNNGTAGLLQIEIPKELMSGNFTVLIDNKKAEYKSSESETHSTIIIDRPSNATTITIQGTNVIPEFPSSLMLIILSIVIAAVPLAKRISLRKHGIQ
jgi:hypothetical protein